MRLKTIAPNQTIVHTVGASTFHSYDTRIATVDHQTGEVTLTTSWDYSRTTTRYLAQFLGLTGSGATAEIRKRLADGRYKIES